MHTVGQLKDSVSGLLQGTNLDNVTNLYGAIERAARTLCQQADVPEASGRQPLVLYDGVFDYTAPTTLFGTAITDVRPQGVSRNTNDYPYKKPMVMFDRLKGWQSNGISLTVEYDRGTAILRASSVNVTPRAILDPMSSTTGWTNGGSIGTIALDEAVYYSIPASLRFSKSNATSSGFIEKTIQQIDLSSYAGVGVCFLAVRLPDNAVLDPTAIQQIELRVGSDSSNYVAMNQTNAFIGEFTAGQWKLIAFDLAGVLSGATTTGTVDYTAIDYVRVTFTDNSETETNIRVGGLWISQPTPSEILFQSSAIFMPSGASPSLTITDDDDEILLNEAAYTLFEHETALTIALQGGGTLASGLVQSLTAILHGSGTNVGLYAEYRGDNPSQELRTVGSWYSD